MIINSTLDLYDEICAMRMACGNRIHLKTILAVGELGSYANVYAASMACMLAGADFIKTSTGKESTVNATLPISVVMCRAIADFQDTYGVKVCAFSLFSCKVHPWAPLGPIFVFYFMALHSSLVFIFSSLNIPHRI